MSDRAAEESGGSRSERPATTLGRSITPELRRVLAAAFRSELETRLPRLLDAGSLLAELGAEVSGDWAASLRTVVSDAHALASSAAVVGADAASNAARACELLLAEYVDAAAVPPARVLRQAADRVEELLLDLAGWIARGAA